MKELIKTVLEIVWILICVIAASFASYGLYTFLVAIND
jgi:hypothetical protein